MNGDVPEPTALLRVLGNELRLVRKQRGWVRKDVQSRMGSDISLQTLATYELGTRGIGVVRLVELCSVLEVPAPELLARTLQQITRTVHVDQLDIDLRAIARDGRTDLLPLRRWARVQLTASPRSSTTASLSWAALEQLAELCDLFPPDLVAALRTVQAKAS